MRKPSESIIVQNVCIMQAELTKRHVAWKRCDAGISGGEQKEHNLPPVVFHSLRHTSVTYKLKLNGGDIKAVQGDSGHSQINMVTDVYSHIIDDDRRKNAELFEEAFYEKKDLDPSMHAHAAGKTVELPTDVDAELLAKVLSNPEMAALLSTLAKSLEKK